MCKRGKPEKDVAWYEDSLTIAVLPLPVPDKSRPWGGNCTKCPGICAGHYLPPQECFQHIKENGTKDCVAPPSVALKKAFEDCNKNNQDIGVNTLTELAKKTLLTTEEVKIWLQHLQHVKERRKGAKKAKATKAKKKNNTLYNF